MQLFLLSVLVILHLHVLVNCICSHVFTMSPSCDWEPPEVRDEIFLSLLVPQPRIGVCQPKEQTLRIKAGTMDVDLCHLQVHIESGCGQIFDNSK